MQNERVYFKKVVTLVTHEQISVNDIKYKSHGWGKEGENDSFITQTSHQDT